MSDLHSLTDTCKISFFFTLIRVSIVSMFVLKEDSLERVIALCQQKTLMQVLY